MTLTIEQTDDLVDELVQWHLAASSALAAGELKLTDDAAHELAVRCVQLDADTARLALLRAVTRIAVSESTNGA